VGSRGSGTRRAVALAIANVACGRYGFSGPDAATSNQPRFELATTAQNSGEATVGLVVAVPTGTPADLYLAVAVAIGGHCVFAGSASPTVSGLALGGAELTPVAAITGTACNATQTRSELWGMVAPPPGSAEVTVQLDATPETLVAAAVVFSGIDPASPVRAAATMSGGDTDASSVAVASAVGDLVVDFVAQGTSIVSPSDGATALFVDDVSGQDTLDNLAASATPSVGSDVVMGWTFGGSDEWQTIAVSLEP
jgi:hypothetical protein